jgi:hypothetical protein
VELLILIEFFKDEIILMPCVQGDSSVSNTAATDVMNILFPYFHGIKLEILLPLDR